MKTRMRTIVSLMLLLSILSGCEFINSQEFIQPSKNHITEGINVEEFSGIISEIVGDIYYTQSNVTSVKVHGPENIVPLITVEKKGDQLILKNKKKIKTRKKYSLKVYITGPDINSLSLKGVGDIYIEEGIKSKKLTISNQGVGDVKAKKLEVENLKINLKGVGDIRLEGRAVNAELISSGVGDIRAYGLETKDLKVASKGVGNVQCFASQSIDLSASGVGDIKYKGNPTEKNVRKKGVGKISSVN